jgi:type I restriction enzyme R subunit
VIEVASNCGKIFAGNMAPRLSDGEHIIDTDTEPEMEPMLKSMLHKENLLDIIRHFIVFEKGKDKTIKKIAAYYQY